MLLIVVSSPKADVSPYTNPCHEKGKIVKLLTNTSQTNDFQMTTGSTLSDASQNEDDRLCLEIWIRLTASYVLEKKTV